MRSEDYLITPAILAALGLSPTADSASYAVDDGAGRWITISVARGGSVGLQAAHNPRMRGTLAGRNPQLNHWFDYIESARAVYMQYNSCAEQASLNPDELSKQFLASYLENSVERIAVDLRNNTGGNSVLIRRLLSGFGELFQSGKLPPTLKLYAFIGPRTFSSGMLNAMDMKRAGFVLVGEPTGGKPSHFADVQTLTLPNSRLLLQYSTRRFDSPDFPGDALQPYILEELSSSDYLAERDPALDRVLR